MGLAESQGSKRDQHETAVTKDESLRERCRVCSVVSKSPDLAARLTGWYLGARVQGTVQRSDAIAANRLFSECEQGLPIRQAVALLFGTDTEHHEVGWALLPVATEDGQEWPPYRRASRLRRCRCHAAPIRSQERG